MAGLGSIFGKGSIGEQLFVWGLLSNVVNTLTQPGINELAYLVNEAFPNVVLSPNELASLAARSIKDPAGAKAEAVKSGIDPDRFDLLVAGNLHAPDLGAVVNAYQRGLISEGIADGTEVSLYGALTDAGVRQQWLPVIKSLAVQIPSVAEVMNAWLEGQIDESEARERFLAAGGDPTWFQTSYNANGSAPTPVEALTMWNRGIIPEGGTGPGAISYEQAFLEGPWRNKWMDAFKALRIYYPPPRTVTAMYHAGQLTHDQSADYLAKQGLTPDLITAYLSPAHHASVTADKVLAKGDILALYADKLLSRAEALKHLEALKYTATDADLILSLTDVKATTAALTAGVSRVRTLFQAGKITEAAAVASLVQLDVPHAQAVDIVDTWAVGQSQPVKVLTPTQIEQAWWYKLMSTEEALAQLEASGYDALDAWTLLSIKNKGPLKDVPKPA